MKTKVRRLLGTGLTAAFVAALLPSAAPVAAAPLACSGSSTPRADALEVLRTGSRNNSNETIGLKSLHIEVKVPKKVYKIGATVKLPVEVTRPAEEDPLGQGIPMDRPLVFPGDGVNVGVGLVVNDVFLPGFAVTDEDGKATINIRIERWARPGTANASFYAWKVQADTVCLRVEEWGFKPIPSAFRISR